MNNLITRGFSGSGSSSLITLGFIPGAIIEVIETTRRIALRMGRSGQKAAAAVWDRVEEFAVSARLLEVNNEEPSEPIRNWVSVSYDKLRKIVTEASKTTQASVKSRIDEIIIDVKRVK